MQEPKLEQTQKITTEQYAYIAGLIDGEGCFHRSITKQHRIGKRKNSIYVHRTLRLSIVNTNRFCLETVQGWLGYGNLQPFPNRFPHKTCFTLDFCANSMRKIIPKIFPYLQIKKTDANEDWEYLKKLKKKGVQISVENTFLSEHELTINEIYAYIAGMIDGEGCFPQHSETASPKTKSSHTLIIANTNIECLQKIRQWLNCGSIHKRNNEKYPTWKVSYTLVLSGNMLRIHLPFLIRYMIIKKELAEKMLAYLQSFKFTKRNIVHPNSAYSCEYERLVKRDKKAYYRQRFADPILHAKKLQQIREYKKRKKEAMQNGKKEM